MEQGRDAIDTSLKLQLALMIIGFLILLRPERSYKMPVLDVEIPTKYLQIIIPFVLVFLWFRFGFVLHNYIDNRVLLDVLMKESVPAVWSDDPVHSPRRLVRDGGFGDAWFAAFRPEFFLVDGPKPSIVHILQLFFYTMVIGMAHACTVALLVNHAAYVRRSVMLGVIHVAMIVTACLWFYVSHAQFHWDGPQPNSMQVWILAVSVVGLVVLLLVSRGPEPRSGLTASVGVNSHSSASMSEVYATGT
jgi:hypothetical protein